MMRLRIKYNFLTNRNATLNISSIKKLITSGRTQSSPLLWNILIRQEYLSEYQLLNLKNMSNLTNNEKRNSWNQS